jgi:hypothetical protein
MKDIKELIYAAVEENAVKFQELVNAQLQVRAYDAIEALRPEIGASMFGESSHMNGKDKGDMDRDGKDEPDSEEYMDNKDAAIKKAMGKKVAEEFEQIDEEAKATVDALKKVHGDHNFHVDKKGEIKHAYLNHSHVKKLVTALNTPGKGKGMIDRMMEEVEGLDELSTEKLLKYREAAKKDADVKNKAWDKKKLSDEGKYKLMNRETGTDQADQKIKRKTGSYRPGILARVGARLRNEEAVNEVAMPKNAADWQAMINHQIQIAGHPVATDAQFRATTVGKDMSKIASLEPGEDMLQYATAQGGTVKK